MPNKFDIKDASKVDDELNLVNTMYMVVMDGSFIFKDRFKFYEENLDSQSIKDAYSKNIELMENDLHFYNGVDYEMERQNIENFKTYFNYLNL